MIDYYLCFEDDEALREGLLQSGAAAYRYNGLQPAEGVAIDVLGVHYDRTGGTDDEPVMTPRPGYFANVRSAQPLTWPGGVELPTPSTPWRVWA